MNKKIKKIIVAIIVTHGLVGCGNIKVSELLTKPYMLDTTPPEGPYEYRQGWGDGCQSGLASTNTNLQLALGTHKFRINRELQSDKLYNIAWQYAYNHCGYSMKSLAQYSL